MSSPLYSFVAACCTERKTSHHIFVNFVFLMLFQKMTFNIVSMACIIYFLLLPWVFLLLPWVFCYCRELFVIAVSFLLLPWPFCYCRELFAIAVSFLLLPWAFCYRRELFVIAVSFLLLPWPFCYRRELFAIAVSFLLLPWHLWATVCFRCKVLLSTGKPRFRVKTGIFDTKR